MARTTTAKTPKARPGLLRRLRRLAARTLLLAVAVVGAWVALYAVVPPPVTPYMVQERMRIGAPHARTWVPLAAISPHLRRAVVAAEDANFCNHWGFDMDAIRAAIAEGAARGASTISQQTVKNAFLWHGRSYVRKALEALLTPLVEAIWPKDRILEVYLNIAEFGEGIFGAEAAAQYYFGIAARDLTPAQSAALATVLPNPQGRDPTALAGALAARAAAIADGAATIAADGRDACFLR